MSFHLHLTFKVFLVLVVYLNSRADASLVENFYASSCPLVEQIVRQTVITKINQTFTTVPATLRLFFHDCFIQGCDASIMIASPNNDAEKDNVLNLSLAGDGFDTVIKAKQAVEGVCPGIVSCADVMAIAARDVVVLSGGPSFNIELGRRDGLISKNTSVVGNIPDPNFKLDQLNAMFATRNLTLLDMIALSGAHTVGSSLCPRLYSRIYSTPIDPTLDPAYAVSLRASCPINGPPNAAIPMDPQTPHLFDNLYYKNLMDRRGLFTSDQVLFEDDDSKSTVEEFGRDAEKFNEAFADAMRKLGRVGVKTGNDGEIRRDCIAFNG